MVTWKEFAGEQPALAKLGRDLLYQFGVGLAFLATVRRDGAPRLHPVCPVLSDDRLYVWLTPDSPKRWDLMRDGRFALQTFPPPREESEEFYISGQAIRVDDASIRRSVLSDTKHFAKEEETLFELLIDRVMHTTWANWGTPELKPVHKKWQASLEAGQ